MELSSIGGLSSLDKAEMTLFTSICNLSCLVVLEGFSSRPYTNTFSFLSGGAAY